MTAVMPETPAPWYHAPGYSMVDHQLDPLLDVIRSWVFEMNLPYDGTAEPDWDRAKLAVDACKAGLDALLVEVAEARKQRAYDAERTRLREAGLPDPMTVKCPRCAAWEHEHCWTDASYPARHPHKARVAAAAERLA